MLKLLNYLVTRKVATSNVLCAPLADGVRGLPMLTGLPIDETECGDLVDGCPTGAITVERNGDGEQVLQLDRGACTTCGFCLDVCPTAAIKNDSNTRIATRTRAQLVSQARLTGEPDGVAGGVASGIVSGPVQPSDSRENLIQKIFGRSIAARVVSTGCSSCDLEIGAAGNPIFDMERFGMHVVASPRFADVLLVTGPVPKAMHEPLRLCYEAMSEPRLVVAVGSCAISGGVHKDNYTQANGAGAVLPVDVFIPGCPPHPWSIIDGIAMAMGRKLKQS